MIAVVERDDLREEADEIVFRHAVNEGRAFLTEDVKRLRPVADRYFAERLSHYGLICVSAKALPRTQRGFGSLQRSIESLLVAHPGLDALADQVVWLS